MDSNNMTMPQANTITTFDGTGYKVFSTSCSSEPDILVDSIHLSCSSDVYRRDDHRYAGFILYAYDGQMDWTSQNGIHCKTGYIVIRSTRTGGDVDRCNTPETPGQVHGAVYKSVFGQNPDKVIGEGFSWIDGELKVNSGTFNDTNSDAPPQGPNQEGVEKWCKYNDNPGSNWGDKDGTDGGDKDGIDGGDKDGTDGGDKDGTDGGAKCKGGTDGKPGPNYQEGAAKWCKHDDKKQHVKGYKYDDDDKRPPSIRKWMSKEGGKCVQEVVRMWKRAGEDSDRLPSCRNWDVKQLLSRN